MTIRALHLKQNRGKFLRELHSQGVKNAESISFLDDNDTTSLGKKLHEIINKVDEVNLENWKEGSSRIREWLRIGDSFLVFENRWDVGALVLSADVLGTYLEVIYRLIGPDFYCVTHDLSHGAVFDKEEYSCFIRMW